MGWEKTVWCYKVKGFDVFIDKSSDTHGEMNVSWLRSPRRGRKRSHYLE